VAVRRAIRTIVVLPTVALYASGCSSEIPADDEVPVEPDPGSATGSRGGAGGATRPGQPAGQPGQAGPAGQGGGAAGSPGTPGAGGGGAGTAGTAGGSAGAAGGGAYGGAATSSDAGPAAAVPVVSETAYLNKVVPVVFLTAGGKAIPTNATKIDGTFKLVEEHDGTLVGIETRAASVETRMGIEVRGNSSSAWYVQKPYGIELRDGMGNGQAVAMMGLPKEADFVLHSCYSDKTCMRNALTYAIGRELATAGGRWAPRTRYVETYLEGKYNGLYLLVEKIKQDKNRVNIPTPAPMMGAGMDISGGYIFSLEGDRAKTAGRTWLDPVASTDTSKKYWAYRFPHYTDITAAQKTYLQGAVAAFERAIDANPKWSDTKPRIDVQSWLDFMLLQELSNNTDGFAFSMYMTKLPDAQGGKFQMGPIWDFDIGYGNVNYNLRYCTNTPLATVGQGAKRPYKTLFMDPALHGELRCRYQELRKPGGVLDVANLESKLDAFQKHIAAAKARDQAKWMNVGKYVWPNNYVGATWADEIRYLKYWIRRRLAFLDAKLPGSCATQPMPPPVMQTTHTPTVTIANRTPLCCMAVNAYIPIEGPAPAMYPMLACPMN
jgi:hypothetical protein